MTGNGSERIVALDAIRGVAVMGILCLNIIVFAMPQAAASNPRAYGLHTPIDLWVWIVDFVALDGRMRGLFSLLFGASMLLIIDRAGPRGAAVHFRRMAALLAFGLIHAVLIWHGDILVLYAATGTLAFVFHDQRPRTLLLIGLASLTINALVMASMPLAVLAGPAASAGFAPYFTPDAADIAAELALYRGGYGGIVADNLRELGRMLGSMWFIGTETLGYMLLGMAAYRGGMLTGQWRRRSYAAWAVAALTIGAALHALVAWWMIGRGFDLLAVATGMTLLPVRVPMVLGYVALILLLISPGGPITRRVAAAGRMAFTNYLATSVVMCLVFYGYGLGLFGHVSRATAYLFVFCMWAAMLLWSKPWLDRFAYGPLEWAWRSLARGSWQRMRAEPRLTRD